MDWVLNYLTSTAVRAEGCKNESCLVSLMIANDVSNRQCSRTDSDGGPVKISIKRTEANESFSSASRTESDTGRSKNFESGRKRLKDEFGRRTGKISKKRTEADAGRRRIDSVPRALVGMKIR